MIRIAAGFAGLMTAIGMAASCWSQEPAGAGDRVKPPVAIPKAFEALRQSAKSRLIGVMGSQGWKPGGSVGAVALSPDGKTGVSGGMSGAVHLWDLATGESLRTLATGASWVEDVAFFPDGKSVLIARVNGRLDVIDVATGATTQWIDTGSQGLRRAAAFPDGERVVAAPYRYPISIYDADAKRLASFGEADEKRQISSLAVTPDGKRVLVGAGNALDVFDVETGKRLKSIDSFKSYVASIAVARDGRKCVCGSGDGTVRLIDLQSGEPLRVIPAHTIRVHAVGFTHGEERVFTGSDDYSLALFELKDGKQVWRKHGPALRCVAITSDGKSAFTGSIHHGVMLWDLDTGEPRGTVSGHRMEVTSLALLGDRAVTGSADGTIRFWDPSGRETRKLDRGYDGAQFVSAEDAGMLAISDRNRGIIQLDVRTGAEKVLRGSQSVSALGVSPDGNTVVGMSNRVLKVWNLAAGVAPRDAAQLPESPNFALTVEPRANIALVFSSDATTGALELWDLTAGKATKTLEKTGVNGFVHPLAISADGTRAAAAEGDELVLWDLAEGKPLQRYVDHERRLVAACLSSDGKRVFSASEDGTVRIFGSDSAEQLDKIELGAAGDVPRSLALSKDGKVLLVGTMRGVALRFELR